LSNHLTDRPKTSTTPMAASSSTLPPVPPASPQVHRTDSLGSNVSAGSATSLSRRPRTKSRPRAVTVSSRRDRSPANTGVLEVSVATAEELLDNTSLSPIIVSPDASPPPFLPSRPPRSPLRAASLPKNDITHPDIVPSLGWKAMDDMESSWRSRALKIEHSTVLVNFVNAFVTTVPKLPFPPSSPTVANAGPAFLVTLFGCQCSHRRRQDTLMHFLPPSAKCKLSLISLPYARPANGFGSRI